MMTLPCKNIHLIVVYRLGFAHLGGYNGTEVQGGW